MGRAKLRKSGPYLWLNSQTGYYCAVFIDENGQSKRKSLKTKDKKEAKRRFNAWHRDWLIEYGQVGDSEPTILVSDFVKEWIAHISTRHPESTTIQYRATANKFSENFGRIKVNEINARTIEQFIDNLLAADLTTTTANKHRRHLRVMLNDAETWGYLPRRPKLPKPLLEKERLKYFTEDQLNSIFAAIVDKTFYDFCLLALLSALRSGEILRLTDADIHNPTGFLRISEAQKNRSESRIPITSAMAPIIERYSSKPGRLFPYSSPSQVSRLFKRVLDAVGLEDYSFHSLRHSYGASMVSKGVDVTAVKELMRHKSIASTMVYAKVSPAHLIDSGERMNFTPDRREIVEKTASENGRNLTDTDLGARDKTKTNEEKSDN